MPQIILVDKDDNPIGTEEKMAAHIKGKLHRCFSLLLFNSKGEMLLQKRAKEKYHSGGLWTNACCSHPRPGENIEQEVRRRVKEEMGIEEIKDLKEIFTFIYKAKLGKLTEYELDHVFVGRYAGEPKPNPKEVEDWKWVDPQELKKDEKENPEDYTEWFRIILDRVLNRVNNEKRVVVGGTFDLIHAGHKALLKKAFALGRVAIGLTSDKMAEALKGRKVEDFKARKKDLEDFIEKEFSERAEIIKIEDKFGFTLEKDFDYIVVSPATYQTATMINQERQKRDKKTIEIVQIDFILAEDGEPISSTKILEGNIDKNGKLIQ